VSGQLSVNCYAAVNVMKRAMFIFCGVCWLGFAFAIGIIAWPYLLDGAVGDSSFIFPLFAPVTSGSVLLGLVHLAGFIALILACLSIGLNLLLHGFYPKQSQNRYTEPQKQP
jgi:hypothetical protein